MTRRQLFQPRSVSVLREDGFVSCTRCKRVVMFDRHTRRLKRMTTSEAVASVTIDELADMLPCPLERAVKVPWWFDPVEGYLMPQRFEGRPEVRVTFTCQQQSRGTRWLFDCPSCERPVRQLFGVATLDADEWGCRTCLGLTYPSQSRHKTVEGDAALLKSRPSVRTRDAVVRAEARDERRFRKEYRRFAVFLGHPLEFFYDRAAVERQLGTGEIVPLVSLEAHRLQPDLTFPSVESERARACLVAEEHISDVHSHCQTGTQPGHERVQDEPSGLYTKRSDQIDRTSSQLCVAPIASSPRNRSSPWVSGVTLPVRSPPGDRHAGQHF